MSYTVVLMDMDTIMEVLTESVYSSVWTPFLGNFCTANNKCKQIYFLKHFIKLIEFIIITL